MYWQILFICNLPFKKNTIWLMFKDINVLKWKISRTEKQIDLIDEKISEHFSEFEYYYRNYDRLQLMNILRILPYVKEEKVRDFVLNILSALPKY